MNADQNEKRVLHCWEGSDDGDGCTGTCLLESGHEGEHEFTPDSDIRLTFGRQEPTEGDAR
jgi:hypothetical protein